MCIVLAQQRYAKPHRILANCRGVKDFRRFRNSRDGIWFDRLDSNRTEIRKSKMSYRDAVGRILCLNA